MNTNTTNEGVMNNSNQPSQTTKNIDYLIDDMNTFEIMYTDIENIFNYEYLKECLERLEVDEYHIQQSIGTIKDRIGEIELNSEREEEVDNNLTEIKELERFIENVCDTDEDIHEPYNKINDLMGENDELYEEITKFYENIKN